MHNRIIKLRDAYAGREVLFLGTGTSVASCNLTNLRDNIVTFGFGRFVPHYIDFWPNLKLDFYMCHDSTVFQTSFYKQFMIRKEYEHDELYNLDNEHIAKYKDVSTADFIIRDKIYERTKIIFSSNIHNPHASRFSLKQNSDWIRENIEIMTNSENFLPYVIDEGVSTYNYPVAVDNKLLLSLWAKNSFCNSALPILFYLGFSKIYLVGVDYSNNGHFFCRANNANSYADKEFVDFELLMQSTCSEIYSIKSSDTKVAAKNGYIDFSELEK